MNNGLTNILLGKLTTILPEIEMDVQRQLQVRRVIEEVTCNYNITTKSKSIAKGDIEEKGNLFLEYMQKQRYSKNTVEWYFYMLKELNFYLKVPCAAINIDDLRNFIAYLSNTNSNRSINTINSYITRLRGFFTWLQQEEYIVVNPAIKLRKLKAPKKIQKAYNEVTVEKLRNACEIIRDKALYELMESTACRVGEIINIKVKDIDFIEQSILVTGKGNKQRLVYFSTRAKIFLEEYIKTRKGDSEYLFLSLHSPYNKLTDRGIRFILQRLKEKAKVTERIFPHNFRRTKATNLLNSGMSLQGVQQFLGHSSPTTTERYATLTQENLKNEYKRLTK